MHLRGVVKRLASSSSPAPFLQRIPRLRRRREPTLPDEAMQQPNIDVPEHAKALHERLGALDLAIERVQIRAHAVND